ncbi:amidohydrolase family protein [candidate division KSB1 bacterium]
MLRPLLLKYVSMIIITFLYFNCTKTYDIVLRNGTVIDGTGEARYDADIGIMNGAIEDIGNLDDVKGTLIIDAQGKYIVPGFIDMHTHGDRNIVSEDRKQAINYLMQGVTTIVTGNCGGGTYNVAEYFEQMESQGIGLNVVHLVGHGTVRSEVMGNADREPSPEEMGKMLALIERAMQEGAAGMSTGLFYAPGSFAKTDEVIRLSGIVKQYGGFYATHIRDESNYTIGLKASIQEALEIGEKSGVPVQISHIKALGKPVWGSAREICGLIEAAQERGVIVYADQYPYTASSTNLTAAVIPRWVQADGQLRERLNNEDLLPVILRETAGNIERRGGPETLVLASFGRNPEWEGRSLMEISALLGMDPASAAVELVKMGSPGIISFNMTDEDVEYFMKKPYVMTGSDGSIPRLGEGKPHPRSYGTFPRKIRFYVFEKGVISLEQAVRAATGLPAEMLGFRKRGLINTGYTADVVIFDPESLRDIATFSNPHQYSTGIEFVIVNGEIAVGKGEYTGALSGKPVRGHSDKYN